MTFALLHSSGAYAYALFLPIQGYWLCTNAGRLGSHATHGQPVQRYDKFAVYNFEVIYCLYSLCCCQAVAFSCHQEAAASPMPALEHCVKTWLSLNAPMSVFEPCLCLGIVPCAAKRDHCFTAQILSQQTNTAPTAMSSQDTFTTPLPLPRPLRRASADIPGTTLTASSHLRKAQSHREGISRSPSGTPFTPLVYRASSHQPLPRKQSILSAIK